MSTPWNRFRLYPRTIQPISRQFQITRNESKHDDEEEERQLHTHRNRIQEYESTLPQGKNWEYYKKAVNPYEWVYTQKKYQCFPESICYLKPLSRSYFKMIEILELSHFFKDIVNGPIRSAHVCEGPGGFIEALYDQASKANRRCQLSVAMTLKSNQCHVPGWKKAAQFLKKNRTVQIIYGHDGTGDILKPENQQHFIDYIHDDGQKVDLFTADGGFDVSDNYEKQETLLFPLLMASTKIGLEALRKGGMFVLKVFDCYHHMTMDLIYFLSCHFEEWTMYKPGMSRPCNPEHYFIGKGFLGCTDEVLDVMRLWCCILENHERLDRLFKIDYVYDSAFLTWIREQRTNSFSMQVEYLEKVFQIIDREKTGKVLDKTDLEENERHSYDWCTMFHVPIVSTISVQPLSLEVGGSQNDLPVSFPQ